MNSHIKDPKLCIIIPTYNNQGTIATIIKDVETFCQDIIVVNDGSTDSTSYILQTFHTSITLVSYMPNQGKGYALIRGFQAAKSMGFTHAITIDADGQHFASDIPSFIHSMNLNPNALIVGNRNLNEDNMPRENTFANKFSNFWFRLQTGVALQDTQSGFRLYPLSHLKGFRFITSRYEAELEFLVFSAWQGIRIMSIPIRVYYPPAEERVTHFRPIYDFARISVLNVFLCIGAIFYGLPMQLLRFLQKQ